MRIYFDLFTQTEIISDSYPFVSFYDGAVVEVQSRMVIPQGVEVDVGCGNAFGGKNEDEEEGAGNAGGAPVLKVNDLIDAFGYQETTLDKKEWQTTFKGFVKKILEKKTKSEVPADQIEKFKANAGLYLKHISGKWDNLKAYTPKDYDQENTTIFSYWKNEEDEAPVFIFYLDGCGNYKV